MVDISPSLVKTWLVLTHSDDSTMNCAKVQAHKKILKYFGSVPVAEIYIEQIQDKSIEVIVI